MTATDTLVLWRDHDDDLRRLPEMSMGSRRIGDEDPATLATALYGEGVRRVGLGAPVDLTDTRQPAALVARLLLVAQLTSHALVIDWEVRSDADGWRLLNHLYPPQRVLDATDADQIRERWRREFYLCKCVWRQGPGFVEVRDRRAGSLARFVIDEPEYLRAIDRLATGCPADEVTPAVLDDLVAEGLVGRVGPLAWWMPYRVRRWPPAALVV